MLEKCSKTTADGTSSSGPCSATPILQVSSIHPDSTFECLAYVRGGRHKFTKVGKPFITLYLQDQDDVVIPGYIFDLKDLKAAGIELTKVIGSVAKIKATENYLPRFGMSVIIDSIYIVSNPDTATLRAFVGEVDSIANKYETLLLALQKHLGIKVSLPYAICTSSLMDYYNGKLGGQCLHYTNMLHVLEVWANSMTEEEARQLFITFVLYIFVHNNYVTAVESGDDDIALVKTLTDSVSKYMKTLKAGDGAIEVIHLFFGYTPKDLFVRLVHQASEINVRMMKELSTFRALPTSREGDAGYGVIKRYNSKGD